MTYEQAIVLADSLGLNREFPILFLMDYYCGLKGFELTSDIVSSAIKKARN